MNHETCPPSPFHHALLGPAPGRLSKLKRGCGIRCLSALSNNPIKAFRLGNAISGQCSFHHCTSHQCRAGMLPIVTRPSSEESCDESATQSRNGCQTFFASSESNP